MCRHILIWHHKSVVTYSDDVGQQRNRVDKRQAICSEEVQPKTFAEHWAQSVPWICDGHIIIFTREFLLDDGRKVKNTNEDLFQRHHVCPVLQIFGRSSGQVTIHKTLASNTFKNVS